MLYAVIGIAAVALLVVLAAAGWFYRIGGRGGETIDSVAVLPFVNASDDPNTEYSSDGITESLINSLWGCAHSQTLRDSELADAIVYMSDAEAGAVRFLRTRGAGCFVDEGIAGLIQQTQALVNPFDSAKQLSSFLSVKNLIVSGRARVQKEDSRKKNIRIERSKTKAVTVVVFWMAALLLGVGAYRSPRVRAQGNTNTGLGVTKLPPDIYPDSLSRMPRARQDQFATDEERAAFAWVAAMAPTVAGTKGVLGPTGTRAQVPELAQAYRLMFNMLEKKCGVEPKYFELAVLVATRQSNNEVEWIDHEARGVKLLGPEVVEIIRNNQDPRGLEEKEALIIELGREVFHQPKVSSETFAGLERNFGRQGTLGISLTMGWYTANALLMHTYDQHADLGAKRPFPDLPATNKP